MPRTLSTITVILTIYLISCLLPAPTIWAQQLGDFLVARSTEGKTQRRYVSLGVWLPPGLGTNNQVFVVRASKRSLRAQSKILDTWNDGSPRFVRLTFPLRLAPGAQRRLRVSLQPSAKAPSKPSNPFLVRGSPKGLFVRSKITEIFLPLSAAEPFLRLGLRRGSRKVVTSAALGISGEDCEITVVENGPYRFIASKEGLVDLSADGGQLSCQSLIILAADRAVLDLEIRAEPAAGGVPAAGLDLHLILPKRISAFKTKKKRQPLAPRQPLVWQVDRHGRESLRNAGKHFEPAPTLLLYSAHGSLLLAQRDFHMLRPSSFELREGRQVMSKIVSDEYHWWQGVAPSRKLRLVFGHSARRPPKVAETWQPPSFTGWPCPGRWLSGS